MKYSINVATHMTLLRIWLTPIIIYLLIHDYKNFALILTCMAVSTDFLDGYIARTYHQETEFGKVLDPLADKIFIFSLLCALFYTFPDHIIPLWFIIMLMIKEFLLICGAILLLHSNYSVLKPSLLSKSFSALLMVSLIYFMMINVYQMISVAEIYVTLFFMLLAMGNIIICIDYICQFYKVLYES